MSKQISIRWNSGLGTNYEDSIEALNQYRPVPELTVGIRIKGYMADDVVKEVVSLAQEGGAEVYVTLTALWGDEVEDLQLRLFGPLDSEQADALLRMKSKYQAPDQTVA